jgi:predicted  nucleic acid-binding Zn ribbon protein
MDCRTLERAATREMSRADSSLSKRGRAICDKVTASTGIPTYYYLYRYTATTMKQERARKCPSCAGEWLLEEPEHIFDFRCDRCRLVSSISFDVR